MQSRVWILSRADGRSCMCSLAMHRVFNIKHRIVRREEILRAPLATFDTIDLGDEDVISNQTQSTTSILDFSQPKVNLLNLKTSKVLLEDGSLNTETIGDNNSKTIGANNSKKSLSQTGGEDKQGKEADVAKEKITADSHDENPDDGKKNNLTASGCDLTETASSFSPPGSTTDKCESPSDDKHREVDKKDYQPSFTTGLSRQGTIGRVSIPIKKQDSDSSSSSGSCNETTFTFRASRPSVGQLENTDSGGQFDDHGSEQDTLASLIPENIDPSQILSPSKRKAYERRIERLRVTTSPIARPRSHTPISVVTLDEYAAISSPELSPAPPSLLPDKLKITLPCDEFTLKPKTPKLQSSKKKDSDDLCFEFTEEILFSRTKSALVVNEDGQVPVSPRRVLIPPTLTPSTSPKLSKRTEFLGSSASEELSYAPKLVYIEQNETAYKIFGETIDEPEEENWASFPDSSCVNVTNEFNRTGESEHLKCYAIPCVTSDSSDSDILTPENVCVKCSLPLSQHSSSLCDFFESADVHQASNHSKNLSFVSFSSTDTPAVLSVQLEATPKITLLHELESDEVLTVAVDQPEAGCNNLVAIDIKSAESISTVDWDESKYIEQKTFDQSDHSLISPEEVVQVSFQSGKVSVVCLQSDARPCPVLDEVIIGQSCSSKDTLLNLDCYTAGDSSNFTVINDDLSPADDHDTGFTQSCSPTQEHIVSNKGLVPRLSITQEEDNNNSLASTFVLLSEKEVNHKSDQNFSAEDLNLDRCHTEELLDADRCPDTEPDPPLLPSINPFEGFQIILPERPPSTNPFERFENILPGRPPSTNPFEECLNILPVQSPITNPFDVFSNIPPNRPPSTNPFDENYEPDILNSGDLSHTSSENIENASSLVDFLSSS
ncbi:hypothetical protein Btru_016548 [Bulinus truncatus]|nr:hypothetical protein Btru_016548 [Bulinus truncatus]